ncbi:MAG: 16S rRNA (cytosine(1402)-N(4))-methyltransferase RsmH [Phycisphaerales bacterium]
MSAPAHIPVLLDEVLALLAPRPGETLLDCTAGLGGHAARLGAELGPKSNVVLMDLDATNLARSAARVSALPNGPRVFAVHGSFAEAPHRLPALGLRADLVLADLGFASTQVDDPSRGLSFMSDGPLDMRLNPAAGPTAADLVASLSEQDLERVIREYGEERHAGAIARAIVQARGARAWGGVGVVGGWGVGGAITRTSQLADIVRRVVRRSPDGIDPATRTFQALRIAVNDELGHLEALLDHVRVAAGSADESAGSGRWLSPGARVAIIAFHSLEDRPVKRAFAELVALGLAEHLGGGPIRPSDAEASANPRARSARLRAIALRG